MLVVLILVASVALVPALVCSWRQAKERAQADLEMLAAWREHFLGPKISSPKCRAASPDNRLTCGRDPLHTGVCEFGRATWYGNVWFDEPVPFTPEQQKIVDAAMAVFSA